MPRPTIRIPGSGCMPGPVGEVARLPKPSWISITPPSGDTFHRIRDMVGRLNLSTVCQEAHCPNMSECWSGGTATFMVLGDSCTRACRFCSVKTRSKGVAVDPLEPLHLVKAVKALGLLYVVLTSVDRDDLPDQGAGHFASCVSALKNACPDVIIEVLIPDFRGEEEMVKVVIDAGPHVLSHNLETVSRLQVSVRDRRANYRQSLSVLAVAKNGNPRVITKSSLMLGLGEGVDEVLQAMDDLRSVGVDILTLGQYLQPSPLHLPVSRFVNPTEFATFQREALKKGFLYCAAGPLVRSSYKAGEYFVSEVLSRRHEVAMDVEVTKEVEVTGEVEMREEIGVTPEGGVHAVSHY